MTQNEWQSEHFIKKQHSFLFKLNVIMLLFSIFVVIVGVFDTSVAFYSITSSRDVFTLHPGDRTLLNGIKLFPLTRQLWKNNECGAASTNDSGSGPAYPNVYVCWKDNEEDCLENCVWERVTQEVSFTDGSLENEQLDEFPNVLTNSSGALIGGSCTGGGLVLLLVVLYFLYKLCKPDNRIHDDPKCARCGRIRSDSRRHGDGDVNAAAVLEVCACMLS